MTTAFSHNREFDFVRMDGLRRATGRPPHEWDFYILKELLDNALDADEVEWRRDASNSPRIAVCVEYIPVPELKSQQLSIEVSNRAVFPVEQVPDIFDTKRYTSRKAFIKGLTRGALGNALKTLLGIPYVMHNQTAGDWRLALKPLSIKSCGSEYLPRYHVDALAQTVETTCERNNCAPVDGTSISIGLDHFGQERPRTLAEIKAFAWQYHLCNPHVAMSWSVSIGEEEWEAVYEADLRWTNKFRGIAPIHWYSLTAFQDVLAALYREQQAMSGGGFLMLEGICRRFVDPEDEVTAKQLSAFQPTRLTSDDISGPTGEKLYKMMRRATPRIDVSRLGAIGFKHVRRVLSATLPVDGEMLYACRTSNDPDSVFVIEAAVAMLREGKRQLWTAMNFSPTYADPFMSRNLYAPVQPDEPVLGLRGFLDAYGYIEETPIVVFVHLISPNLETNEFSKTEINHVPYKQVLGEMLDQLCTELRQQQEEGELQLEESVYQILDMILQDIRENERFIPDQLREKVHAHLLKNLLYASWLGRAEASARLQTYITTYLTRNNRFAQIIARPAIGMITIPLHPDRHFAISTEHISKDLFVSHHVNKILYVQERALEEVVIGNHWLSRLDMALLHNPQESDGLRSVVMQSIVKSGLPVLVWHNADDEGEKLVAQMQTWISERHIEAQRLIDLGLYAMPDQPTQLIAMMPGEQIAWLQRCLEELHLPLKALPRDQDLRHDIGQRLEDLFFKRLMERLNISRSLLYQDFDLRFHIVNMLRREQLDIVVRQRLLQAEYMDATYDAVVNTVVNEFFQKLLQQYNGDVQRFMRSVRLVRVDNEGEA
jgi:DNA topoisomerase VI subunit B